MKCGFCMTNHHNCIGARRQYYFDVKRGKSVLVWLDTYTHCACTRCNSPQAAENGA